MVGGATGSEFRPDLTASVATEEDEVLGLSLSQQVYLKLGCHCPQQIYSVTEN